MKLLYLFILNLSAIGMAYASSNVQLNNLTPQNGTIGVKYQMLCEQQGKTMLCGEPALQLLTPQQPQVGIPVPAVAVGLRVLAMQYRLNKSPDHWFVLPTDKCQWTDQQGQMGVVNVSATQHLINCQAS